MNNGGRAALLHYLQTYDLSDFDVRDVPNTVALAEQKMDGLRNVDLWWYEKLEAGDLSFDHYPSDWQSQSQVILRSEIYDDYERFMTKRRFKGEVLTEAQFGKWLKSLTKSETRSLGPGACKRSLCDS